MAIKIKKIALSLLTVIIAVVIILYALSYYINIRTEDEIYSSIDEVPEAYTVIVLGASVKSNGNLSTMLEDRVKSALQLYRAGKVERFLLSGDNGTKEYNEPKAMKEYLLERDIPEDHIYLDYAGFDTYDSMYRAKEVFGVEKAIIVTQGFHLPRAVFIAKNLGLDYKGYIGDKHIYEREETNQRRELLANVKAYLELIFHKEPTYLGSKIPINGPPQSTYKEQ